MAIHKSVRTFPKIERHTLGESLDRKALLLLELSLDIKYSVKEDKLILINDIVRLANTIKILVRVAFDLDILSANHYLKYSSNLEEIGKMAGGFKRYLSK